MCSQSRLCVLVLFDPPQELEGEDEAGQGGAGLCVFVLFDPVYHLLA